MLFRTFTPSPPLDRFVEYLWAYSDAPSHSQERILPSGTLELVVNLEEDEIRICDPEQPERYNRYRGAIVSGTYQSYFVIDARQQSSLVGVHFRPGGASPVLGVPAESLANRHVDLRDLWGSAAAELRERLCEDPSTEARFRRLEASLRSRILRPVERHRAVPAALEALANPRATRVRELSRDLGLSQRRFIRVFAAEVGLTPKLFSRVRRFQGVVARLGRVRSPDWARLAVGCGYCDQSHLIREFVEFSGLSPAAYLQRRTDQIKELHVPTADPGQLPPIPAPLPAADLL
jgi:AraC-like DNA-binding protein